MKTALPLALLLLCSLSAPAAASCQQSMVATYQGQCTGAVQSHDDSAAIDACLAASDQIDACRSEGQPRPNGELLRAQMLSSLAGAYAATNQREKARAAYAESATVLETFAQGKSGTADERRDARKSAARARAAAAAL